MRPGHRSPYGLQVGLDPDPQVSQAHNEMPGKLETGTQDFEGVAGLLPAIDFVARLGAGTTRRERLVSGYGSIQEHESALADMIRLRLAMAPGVTLCQAGPDVQKVPTVAFRAEGWRRKHNPTG